jgi:hypothetical protein
MNPRDFFCIPTKPEKIASTVPRVPDLFKASVRNHWGPGAPLDFGGLSWYERSIGNLGCSERNANADAYHRISRRE